MKLRLIVAASALAAFPVCAQLAPANSAGAAMGHVHLVVKNVEAHQQLFGLLGGTNVKNGPLDLIQFPGVFIAMRKGEPTAGTVGSRVNHFGFHVKSVAETLAKIRPLGLKIEQNNPQQAFVTTSDDVRIELLEDANMPMPIRMHHVHMFVANPSEVQAWYGKVFGAAPGKRGQFETANIPGVEFTLTKDETALQPTKGRSLDHIGIEVKNLEEFAKRLETVGLTYESAIRPIPNTKARIAFITDPWGTYIEITENSAPGS
jgi:catechol 2,3-dioxygenase-like lactoylglutathione lyase family enzyme